MKQSLRIALEFIRWYDFKAGKATFREFADSVLADLVLNGAIPKLVEIRVFGHDGGLITTDDPADDYRWAFGRLLEGQAKARVDSHLIVWFQLPNWVRIATKEGDLSRSRCVRRAAVWMPKRASRPKIMDFDRATENLEQNGNWYDRGERREYRGLELCDPWVMMASFRQASDVQSPGVPNATPKRQFGHNFQAQKRDVLSD